MKIKCKNWSKENKDIITIKIAVPNGKGKELFNYFHKKMMQESHKKSLPYMIKLKTSDTANIS